VSWDEARLRQMRQAFLTALDDPSHPVWDRLLFGRTFTDAAGRRRSEAGVVDVMERHPFGHDCEACRKWRRESIARKDGLAQIEADVLRRRGQPYDVDRKWPTLRDTA
jgi:hypothetical protein